MLFFKGKAEQECFRMLVENESTFVAALKTDLNKPLQESIMSEIDFLRNDVISILRNIKTWTKDQ